MFSHKNKCKNWNVKVKKIERDKVPCNVPANPADLITDERVLMLLLLVTESTMLPVGGIITVSMTCTSPLEAVRSKLMILDPSTVTKKPHMYLSHSRLLSCTHNCVWKEKWKHLRDYDDNSSIYVWFQPKSLTGVHCMHQACEWNLWPCDTSGYLPKGWYCFVDDQERTQEVGEGSVGWSNYCVVACLFKKTRINNHILSIFKIIFYFTSSIIPIYKCQISWVLGKLASIIMKLWGQK